MLFCVTSLSVSGVKMCFVPVESGICSCLMEQWCTCTDRVGPWEALVLEHTALSADTQQVRVLTSGRDTPSLLLLCTSLPSTLVDKEPKTSWQSLWWLM